MCVAFDGQAADMVTKLEGGVAMSAEITYHGLVMVSMVSDQDMDQRTDSVANVNL